MDVVLEAMALDSLKDPAVEPRHPFFSRVPLFSLPFFY
jgi:hypothetical protein